MAQSIRWPSHPLFHPFGNTSPVNVAEYIPWNQKADILLLGCGDPRNIFFTLQACGADKPSNTRKFDFTCCDIEPSIIARNIILLTLSVDDLFHERRQCLWNIFYDVFLDHESISLLTEQCTYLASLSTSLSTWRTSQYSEFIRFSSASTLQQVRRYWQWYAKAAGPPASLTGNLKEHVVANMHRNIKVPPYVMSSTSCRSAGPMWQQTILTGHEAFCQWWRTGLTTNDPERSKIATRLNPTFACANFQPGFHCDPAIAPLNTFHLSPACNPLEASASSPPKYEPDSEELYRVAKAQFQSWLDMFRACLHFTGRVVLRFAACDCLTLCPTLEEYKETGRLSAELRLHPYTVTRFVLDHDEYNQVLHRRAPCIFDVIDTSTLSDHIGMLNCIVAGLPLLKRTPWATFYTKTRLQTGQDPTRGITTSLCCELSAATVLFDLTPVSYISGFETHSNIQENLPHHLFRTVVLYHERLAWKRPSQLTRPGEEFTVSLEPEHIATLLIDMFLGMFRYEDVRNILDYGTAPSQILLRDLCRANYTRQSFVLLLRLLQRRILTDWDAALDTLLERLDQRMRAPIIKEYAHEFRCQLHLHGLLSFPELENDDEERYNNKRAGPFCDWKTIPPVVCIVAVVPQASTDVLSGPNLPYNPYVNAVLDDGTKDCNFACLETAFGQLSIEGTGEHVIPIVKEDLHGTEGASPWLVSFLAPAALLVHSPERTTINLAVSTTVENALYENILPHKKRFFTAPLMDRTQVHVFAQRLTWSEKHPLPIMYMPPPPPITDPGIRVALGDSKKDVKTFTARAVVDNERARAVLSDDHPNVKVEQIEHCKMELVVGGDWSKILEFPFSICGSTAKLRIARSSGWIEVIVEMASFEKCEPPFDRFPVTRHMGVVFPWNVHSVMPDICPRLATDQPHLLKWIGLHMRFAFSDKERQSVDHRREQKTIVQVKKALYIMFTCLAGYKGTPQHHVFAIHRARGGLDSVILVSAVRLDLAAHSLFADAYLLPLRNHSGSNELNTLPGWKEILSSAYAITLSDGALTLWKHMLPAMAERCRDYRHKLRCAYHTAGRIPASSQFQMSPLCQCGEGGVDEHFKERDAWAPFAAHATRIVLSPLFAVSFLESVGANHAEVAEEFDISAQTLLALAESDRRGEIRGPNLQIKPAFMRPPSIAGNGSPANGPSTDATPSSSPTQAGNKCRGCGMVIPDGVVKVCSRCRIVRYCSRDCQVKDWKNHKPLCSPTN